MSKQSKLYSVWETSKSSAKFLTPINRTKCLSLKKSSRAGLRTEGSSKILTQADN